MITKDPYGVAGAVRAWDGIYAGRPEHKPKRRYNQKEIDMCLTCTLDMAECHGNCTKKRKDQKPPGDPCRQCYSREICHRIGGTCGEKERWTNDCSKNRNEKNTGIL